MLIVCYYYAWKIETLAKTLEEEEHGLGTLLAEIDALKVICFYWNLKNWNFLIYAVTLKHYSLPSLSLAMLALFCHRSIVSAWAFSSMNYWLTTVFFWLQASWLPTLRNLVLQINGTFGHNFQEMAVAGEVSLGINRDILNEPLVVEKMVVLVNSLINLLFIDRWAWYGLLCIWNCYKSQVQVSFFQCCSAFCLTVFQYKTPLVSCVHLHFFLLYISWFI